MSETAPTPAAVDSTAPTPSTEAPAPVEIKVPEVEPFDDYEIDGKTVRLTRTQARTQIQKATALDKRMQETAETKKKLDSLISDFEKDPEAALAKLGKDPEKILQALIERKAKMALLTPEQREAQALKEERDALKAEKDRADAERKKKADEELDQHNQAALEGQLVAIADKYGLDKEPEALGDLADVALDLLETVGEHVTMDQVAQEYLRREEEHIEARDKKLLPKLKGERLEKFLKTNIEAVLKLPPADLLRVLGPEGVKAIQAATLTKAPTATKVRAPDVKPPPRNGQGRYVSEADINKKFGTR